MHHYSATLIHSSCLVLQIPTAGQKSYQTSCAEYVSDSNGDDVPYSKLNSQNSDNAWWTCVIVFRGILSNQQMSHIEWTYSQHAANFKSGKFVPKLQLLDKWGACWECEVSTASHSAWSVRIPHCFTFKMWRPFPCSCYSLSVFVQKRAIWKRLKVVFTS